MARTHSGGQWPPALAGLPRPGPQSLPRKRAIQAVCDLRQVRPPIYLSPEDEGTLIQGILLTREKGLRWLAVLKQLLDQRTLPPVSFLNLLTSWIDVYAQVEGRRKKPPDWRWHALRGFVHRERRLQSRKLLRHISHLANSIAVRLDHPLYFLWGNYLRDSQPKGPSSREPSRAEPESEGTRVFKVLKRVVVNKGKALAEDYLTLKPYVSQEFKEPIIKKYLPDPRELKSLEEFVARAAAMDVYVQWVRMDKKLAFDQSYVRDVTSWLLKLGEPKAKTQIEAIHWHFCARPTVNLKQRSKKSVLRSKAT